METIGSRDFSGISSGAYLMNIRATLVRRFHTGHGYGVVGIASGAASEHRLGVCVHGGFIIVVEGFQGVFGGVGFAAEGVRTRGQGRRNFQETAPWEELLRRSC